MASSSTSSVQKSFKYDVFLSFRGEDTRKTFVDHLYHALQQKSIHTYKDDERIKKGKRISDELMKSIEDSKFYIIIFSKNYASSSWCLDELVKIMECQKTTTEHTAYPVFYDVEPTEVRKQSGEFGKGFAKYEKEEAAVKWREALKEASALAGLELKNTFDGHEAKFIQKIVEEISLELRSNNFSVDEKLIGMEARIRDVVSSLEIGIGDVRMIGIKGIGGGGKTTLARVVFDQISFRFEGSSFVENVRENSSPNFSGLKKLQKQVLKDVLNDSDIKISNVHDGKKMMKKMMCCRKVLLVLDDVDHIDQLKALAGEFNWFNEGSRIIITTRDEQVLVAHGVKSISNVNLLSHEEAICLLSRYAFGRESPIQGYKELSGQVVGYVVGLPLTITVLGSFLCGKSKLEWKDAIERLKTIPLKDTLEKLELSYIGLEEDHKEIFLDVACIMKGWEKEKAIKVLECCGFHARIGLRVLEQKSLITTRYKFHKTINKYGSYFYEFLQMHDHIEEMGKNIVRRLHPSEPNRHSRLWIDEEIEDILANNQGTGATTCIQLDTSEVLNPEIVMKGLGNMKNLRCLLVELYRFRSNDSYWELDEVTGATTCIQLDTSEVLIPEIFMKGLGNMKNLRRLLVELYRFRSKDSDWEFDEVSQYFPNALRHLSWYTYPFGSLPKTFQANNLVALEMRYSRIVQLWEGGERRVLKKLKFLNFGYSVLESLDLGLTPNLEDLNLEECVNLVQLHVPVECPNLKSLNLYCSKLRTLDLRRTPNLETLSLKKCDNLIEFRIPVECLLNLRSLIIDSYKLRTLDLRGTPYLETLRLVHCGDLVEIHFPVECLRFKCLDLDYSKLSALDLRGAPNLETLSVRGCNDLVEIHFPVECLRFKCLDLGSSKLSALDLRGEPNLETLSVRGCNDLVEIHFPVECLRFKCLDLDSSKLSALDLRGAPNLETLSVRGCNDLVEIHFPVECLRFKCLDLDSSKLSALDFRGAPNLETLSVRGCYDLVEIHFPVECLRFKCLYLGSFKSSALDLRGAPNLETLSVGCNDLVEIHFPVECLRFKRLDLGSSKLSALDLRGAPNLEALIVRGYDLVEIHFPVECLRFKCLYLGSSKLSALDLRGAPNLETLSVRGCNDLVEIHFPVECLRFKCLDLDSSKLSALDLRGAPNLETLSVRGCYDLVEIHFPVECLRFKCLDLGSSKLSALDLQGAPNLKTLSVRGCYDLVELHIHIECPKLESVDIMGAKLRTLDLGLTPNLKTLNLTECYHLVEVHAHDESLKKLDYIKLSDSLRFKFLFIRKLVQSLEAGSLSKLHLIAESLDIWPTILHPDNNLPEFGFTCLYKEHGPSLIGNIEKLISVGLSSCTNLESYSQSICGLRYLTKLTLEGSIPEAPKDLDQLQCLEELHLLSTKITHLPDSICMLKRLKCLELNRCWLLEKLPEDLGRLECLEKLILSECVFLQDIPSNICKMKRLEYFHLRYCVAVVNMPDEFWRLECLKELNIEGTSIRHLPQSIFELKGLRIVAFRWLLQSHGFASEIQTSEDETFCYVEL